MASHHHDHHPSFPPSSGRTTLMTSETPASDEDLTARAERLGYYDGDDGNVDGSRSPSWHPEEMEKVMERETREKMEEEMGKQTEKQMVMQTEMQMMTQTEMQTENTTEKQMGLQTGKQPVAQAESEQVASRRVTVVDLTESVSSESESQDDKMPTNCTAQANVKVDDGNGVKLQLPSCGTKRKRESPSVQPAFSSTSNPTFKHTKSNYIEVISNNWTGDAFIDMMNSWNASNGETRLWRDNASLLEDLARLSNIVPSLPSARKLLEEFRAKRLKDGKLAGRLIRDDVRAVIRQAKGSFEVRDAESGRNGRSSLLRTSGKALTSHGPNKRTISFHLETIRSNWEDEPAFAAMMDLYNSADEDETSPWRQNLTLLQNLARLSRAVPDFRIARGLVEQYQAKRKSRGRGSKRLTRDDVLIVINDARPVYERGRGVGRKLWSPSPAGEQAVGPSRDTPGSLKALISSRRGGTGGPSLPPASGGGATASSGVSGLPIPARSVEPSNMDLLQRLERLEQRKKEIKQWQEKKVATDRDIQQREQSIKQGEERIKKCEQHILKAQKAIEQDSRANANYVKVNREGRSVGRELGRQIEEGEEEVRKEEEDLLESRRRLNELFGDGSG
ncbi:unnamed protein product [Zymoseptoria tritici ST99CH_1A5]|uniref:Uncharacterized protein n=1 Tax=Zymoseptoria tritici ST99CH_1A5 TaxID=1276529 RepID=A0A1Y6M1E1_ZYMTR|nr:unnamed protein product [Zymoseptoria tritici ST99CH_1A5]